MVDIKEELKIPRLGLIFMLISIVIFIVALIDSILNNNFDLTETIAYLITSISLTSGFALGLIGIKKQKFVLEKIGLLIFCSFIVFKSTFELIEYHELFKIILNPEVFQILLPYVLFAIFGIINFVLTIIYFKKDIHSKIIISSFISRLVVVPMLALSIYEVFGSMHIIFADGFTLRALLTLFIALGTIASELSEHSFFDYMGDMADRDHAKYYFTKEASLLIVINIGVSFISSAIISITELSVDTLILNIFIVLFNFVFIGLYLYFYLEHKMTKLKGIILLLSKVIYYGLEITYFIFLIYYPATDMLTYEIVVASIVLLSFMPISTFLTYLTFKVRAKEDEKHSLTHNDTLNNK